MTDIIDPTVVSPTPASNGTATEPANGTPADPANATSTAPAPLFDAERRATELAILDALRAVVDPEIGMNVVELALIKQILLGPDSTEIKMILTTPFCPYAGAMIAQVKEQAESVVEHDVKVTLLAERWDPRDAGLMW
jgi:metal-sulfur cluster biosynthetic enzyme